MPLLAVNGHRAHVVDMGAGPAVVLVHGLAGSAAGWHRIAGPLAEEARVVAYDARGTGASEVTPGPYRLELLADDLLAVIQALALEDVIVVGHSMGATVALLAAARDAAPIRGVVAIGTAFEPAGPEQRAELAGLAAMVEAEGMAAVAEQLAAVGTSPAFRTTHPAAFQELVDGLSATDPAGFAARARGLGTFALGAHLNGLQTPVLLLVGDADPLSPMERNQVLARELGDAVLVSLGEGMHESPIAQPGLLLACIRRFLKSAGRS